MLICGAASRRASFLAKLMVDCNSGLSFGRQIGVLMQASQFILILNSGEKAGIDLGLLSCLVVLGDAVRTARVMAASASFLRPLRPRKRSQNCHFANTAARGKIFIGVLTQRLHHGAAEAKFQTEASKDSLGVGGGRGFFGDGGRRISNRASD